MPTPAIDAAYYAAIAADDAFAAALTAHHGADACNARYRVQQATPELTALAAAKLAAWDAYCAAVKDK